ncbi:hypothetical protein CO121_00335 [bacterium (Candidatus Gribaldobacteria) CG_4_9_14_3_um_filter_36_15]|uniref:Uncharacterized protein n=4 Tax=Candidatus Gribaldobacteria TaxID=2798536 RepID=A0A2M7VKD9_9BACT|nr:MAG: hypothetical protein AUK07_01785 [Parcubacteria group bacterium CG2_30_36_21]PIR91266.1 MAG: hypothetical protein COU02_00760 [bacterium (Candidatus Gribaldobacteria) CG10_big_fil_rev_8_21_14_0_10_37_46]PIV14201.1 MAG: hypothetical protein COS44_00265 [bacterium (Candidatus Gribaldobacteria) CG03_land_8_20_14_0_80_36_40]PJA02310.1 MAG: hypothetical protein COX73_01505 [bacterium (Candidatus Gribaldobacteria) CG_4_10_14_0_2_um_filter_36_18]PJB09353.1 MAG: hypothetical protein CO121_00335
MEQLKFTSKFPPFFQLHYLLLRLISAVIVIAIFYISWNWQEKKRMEDMRRSTIINCILSCQSQKAQKDHMITTDPAVTAACAADCQKQYGNY